MAHPTPHKHLGFNVEFDGLIQRGNIQMHPDDFAALHANTAKSAAGFQGNVEDALSATDLNATQVGPISGPDAGTGPLVPVSDVHPQEVREEHVLESMEPENPQPEPTEYALLPEEQVAEVPLHPTPDPDPHGKAEQEKAEWIRKEAEAKEHPAE